MIRELVVHIHTDIQHTNNLAENASKSPLYLHTVRKPVASIQIAVTKRLIRHFHSHYINAQYTYINEYICVPPHMMTH